MISTVELEGPQGRRSFEFSHAERILSLKENGGWRLPKDSGFKFEDNGIKRVRHKEVLQRETGQVDH